VRAFFPVPPDIVASVDIDENAVQKPLVGATEPIVSHYLKMLFREL
jgi:hypothetical protein